MAFNQFNPPEPFDTRKYPAVPPVIMTLLFEPRFEYPATLRPVRFPSEVMFGCAFDATEI